eukprot:6439052-Ditylum_brightwellii.AAC.1
MVSNVQVEAKLQRMKLKRKHSEIVQSQKNERLLVRTAILLDFQSQNVIGHKTDKMSELRDALEQECDEVKELKEEIEALKKMK